MIRKIPVVDLEPGMVVAQLKSNVWEQHPYIYTKPGVIKDREQVLALLDKGFQEVFVEVQAESEDGRTLSTEEAVARHLDNEGTVPPEATVGLLEEMGEAEKIYVRSLEMARKIVRDVAEGRDIDVDAAGEVVGSLIDSALRNHQTLACLSKLDTYDDYTFSHCVNVSALSVVFGRFLDLDRDNLTTLGLAGLFHDLGKVRIDSAILNKPGRLNEQEFEVMKCHPAYSRDILMEQKVDEAIVRGAAEHHEKYNASGYPEGLPPEAVSPLSRILALADVFDALTSRRPYKAGLLPNKALSIMYGMRGQDFAPGDVDRFIKCLGIYPTGSLVQLSTGDFAVVLHNRPDNLLKPIVMFVVSSATRHSGQLDLALDPLDDKGKPIRIEECLDPHRSQMDVAGTLGVSLQPRAH